MAPPAIAPTPDAGPATTWPPEVGDEVWFEFACTMEVGRIEAIKHGCYAVRFLSGGVMNGHLTVRTKDQLWPPELMAKVGSYPPGWRTAPNQPTNPQ